MERETLPDRFQDLWEQERSRCVRADSCLYCYLICQILTMSEHCRTLISANLPRYLHATGSILHDCFSNDYATFLVQ
jgi:hypothetical protein